MDDLQRENDALKKENQTLLDRVVELERLVKQLTEQLNQNSRNSSWARPAVINHASQIRKFKESPASAKQVDN